MKPSDFFLSKGQFLGALIPGVLWMAAGLWICGSHPLVWLEQAKPVALGVFFVGSYLTGHIIQSIVFTWMDEPGRWEANSPSPDRALRDRSTSMRRMVSRKLAGEALRSLRTQVRCAVQQYPWMARLNDHQLGQFCKRYAADRSEFFQRQFQDQGDQVGFTCGIAFPLAVLAVVGIARSLFPDLPVSSKRTTEVFALTLMLMMAIYLCRRIQHSRLAEEENWYRSFLMLWETGDKLNPVGLKEDPQDDQAYQ